MSVHSFDVLGYYPLLGDAYGEPFCADCAPWHGVKCVCCQPWDIEKAAPIFRDSESDTPTHCVACEALIHHSLTTDGVGYVYEALQIGTGRPEILAVWRDAYAHELEAAAEGLAELWNVPVETQRV